MSRRQVPPAQGTAQAGAKRPHLRADARRNLDRILAAAREVFLEQGFVAPLDEIAQRAEVGIATLYRRFPDRHALVRGVALDVWRQAAHEAREAQAGQTSAFQALACYLHRALDLGFGAVMPGLLGQATLDGMDDEMRAARDQSAETVQRMVAAAQADGTLRTDVTFADTGLLLIRLSRPISTLPRILDRAIAHRHLDVLLAGLRADGAEQAPLPGPALTVDELRAMPGE